MTPNHTTAMRIRPPAVPLFVHDPYFSVWAPAERLTDRDACHWTGRANVLRGTVEIDGRSYRFLGRGPEPALEQEDLQVDALATTATFRMPDGGAQLVATFVSPLLPDDWDRLSLPVSFLELRLVTFDGRARRAVARLAASEQFCLDKEGDAPVDVREAALPGGLADVSVGSAEPRVLERSGDDLRVEWGRFHLAARGGSSRSFREDAATFATRAPDDHADTPRRPDPRRGATAPLVFAEVSAPLAPDALFLAGFDDGGTALQLFGERVPGWWQRGGKSFEEALAESAAAWPELADRCAAFSETVAADARAAGGARHAELCALAWRQAVGAHKLVADARGEAVFVSKENFSNGCAATVDVTYPSAPLFLLYAPRLVEAMLRPVHRFAASRAWRLPYAPHDCGRYPLVDGQVYGVDGKTKRPVARYQMPVEECGNVLVLESAAALAAGDASFAASHLPRLRRWAAYLETHGADPGEQLCTDDFAGHLAHNCNLALKAVVALAAFAKLLRLLGEKAEARRLAARAKAMAKDWLRRAANPDGSLRLAFDRPGSFSLKYNAAWDRALGLGLFPDGAFDREFARYRREALAYGVPLDDRRRWTKSDWIAWCAAFAPDRAAAAELLDALWRFYDATPDRVPMTDWYWTDTGTPAGFRARSVVGGFFMPVLAARATR